MTSSSKLIVRKLVLAIATTIAIGGVLHIGFAAILSIYHQSISYINPVDFLGISYIWPQFRDSVLAAIISWLILVVITTVIFIFSLRNDHDQFNLQNNRILKRIAQLFKQ